MHRYVVEDEGINYVLTEREHKYLVFLKKKYIKDVTKYIGMRVLYPQLKDIPHVLGIPRSLDKLIQEIKIEDYIKNIRLCEDHKDGDRILYFTIHKEYMIIPAVNRSVGEYIFERGVDLDNLVLILNLKQVPLVDLEKSIKEKFDER